jgi:hypothetical protein
MVNVQALMGLFGVIVSAFLSLVTARQIEHLRQNNEAKRYLIVLFWRVVKS